MSACVIKYRVKLANIYQIIWYSHLNNNVSYFGLCQYYTPCLLVFAAMSNHCIGQSTVQAVWLCNETLLNFIPVG